MLTGTLLDLAPIGTLLEVLRLPRWATGSGAAAPAWRWPEFRGIKLDLMLGAGGGCHEITRHFSWMTAASYGDHRRAPPRPVNRGETPAASDEMFKASA